MKRKKKMRMNEKRKMKNSTDSAIVDGTLQLFHFQWFIIKIIKYLFFDKNNLIGNIFRIYYICKVTDMQNIMR